MFSCLERVCFLIYWDIYWVLYSNHLDFFHKDKVHHFYSFSRRYLKTWYISQQIYCSFIPIGAISYRTKSKHWNVIWHLKFKMNCNYREGEVLRLKQSFFLWIWGWCGNSTHWPTFLSIFETMYWKVCIIHLWIHSSCHNSVERAH